MPERRVIAVVGALVTGLVLVAISETLSERVLAGVAMLLLGGGTLLVALRPGSKPPVWGVGPLDILLRVLPDPWWRVLVGVMGIGILVFGVTAVRKW